MHESMNPKMEVFIRKYGSEHPSDALSQRERIAYELLPEGIVLVEIGCGVGRLSSMASRKFDLVVGMDLMIDRLSRARILDKNRAVQFVVGDMDRHLPFRKESVSCVACIASFEYALEPFFFLDEINRILAADGTLLFQIANLVWLPRRLYLIAGRMPSTGALQLMQDRVWNGGYLHEFTFHDIQKLLNECGFQVAKWRSSGRLRKLAVLWPSLLASDFLLLCKKKSRKR